VAIRELLDVRVSQGSGAYAGRAHLVVSSLTVGRCALILLGDILTPPRPFAVAPALLGALGLNDRVGLSKEVTIVAKPCAELSTVGTQYFIPDSGAIDLYCTQPGRTLGGLFVSQ